MEKKLEALDVKPSKEVEPKSENEENNDQYEECSSADEVVGCPLNETVSVGTKYIMDKIQNKYFDDIIYKSLDKVLGISEIDPKADDTNVTNHEAKSDETKIKIDEVEVKTVTDFIYKEFDKESEDSDQSKAKILVNGSEEEPPSEAGNDKTKNTDRNQSKALDDLILKTLAKVKYYFLNHEMKEHKLAEFIFQILTLNFDAEVKDSKTTDVLESLVTETVKPNSTEADEFSGVLNKMLDQETAKLISDKLCSEKVDDIIERILGKDTKQLICEKLESDNLDDLLNKLIDEKMNLDDADASHPNFDEFIDKILGKDTEEYIRKKLEAYSSAKDTDAKHIATPTEK